MEDHQPAVQVAGKGGARVKCVGGLVEFSAQNTYSKGVQRFQRTPRRKNKAHHNDASSTGYLITITLHL